MKKILSFTLVLAMILGSVSFCFAEKQDFTVQYVPTAAATKAAGFTDVTPDMDCYEAVNSLKAIGCVAGTGDGKFDPNAVLTRAQMVAFVIKAMGYPVTQGKAYVTPFADVPATDWFAGYVYWGNLLGVVQGRTATKFDPNAKVTVDEAIAFTLRVLGYDDTVKGGYPGAYLAAALSKYNFDEIVEFGTASITRGEVAQLFNAIKDADAGTVSDKGVWTVNSDLPTIVENAGYTVSASEWDVYVTYEMLKEETSKYYAFDLKPLLGQYIKRIKKNVTPNEEGMYVDYIPVGKIVSGFAGTTAATYTLGGYNFKPNAPLSYNFIKNTAQTSDTIDLAKAAKNETVGVDYNAYKFQVKIDPETNLITKVYALVGETWEATTCYVAGKTPFTAATATSKVAKLEDKATLALAKDANGYDTLDVDYTQYQLVGIEKFEDIKEGDLVTLFKKNGTGAVVKVEVTKNVVTGTVARVEYPTSLKTTETTKYVIDGTKYEANGATIKAGDKGTFYLYDGKIVAFVADKDAVETKVTAFVLENTEATTKAALELKGDYYVETVAKISASVKLLGTDGTVATYEYATADDAKLVHDGDFVTYTLKNGKISTVTVAAIETGSNVEVAKNGAAEVASKPAIFNADTVVVVYNDTKTTATITNPINNPANYIIVKGSDLAEETLTTVKLINDEKSGFVKLAYAEVEASEPAADVYVVTAVAALADATEYTALNLMDGKTYVFTATKDTMKRGDKFTEVVVNTKGMMTCTAASIEGGTSYKVETNALKVVEGMFFVAADGTKYEYVGNIADDAVVYAVDKYGVWTVKTVADLTIKKDADSKVTVEAYKGFLTTESEEFDLFVLVTQEAN